MFQPICKDGNDHSHFASSRIITLGTLFCETIKLEEEGILFEILFFETLHCNLVYLLLCFIYHFNVFIIKWFICVTHKWVSLSIFTWAQSKQNIEVWVLTTF